MNMILERGPAAILLGIVMPLSAAAQEPPLPTVYFSFFKNKAVALHILVAQTLNPDWQVLTVSIADKKLSRQRRDQVCTDKVKQEFSPGSCDEYPFATTLEGGKQELARSASVMAVPLNQNSSQGGTLKQFYYPAGVPRADGTKFCVVVGP